MSSADTHLFEQIRSSLADAYTVTRELGRGGMSRVFVAQERSLDREVVIKVLSPDLAAGVSAERFAREVKLAAQLQQANIVPVISAGEVVGLPYYTMPYVEGESLRMRLDAAETAGIPAGEAVSILTDLAKALAYAHGRGIVHRDIKPENILLSGGTAVVTDFGIAKAISASRTLAPFETLTQVGTSLGTPAYMSPEQAMGDPSTNHRADIYAFGVVAYEMLAGSRPFTASTQHELVRAHMIETPAPVSSKRSGLPPALAKLVMACLEKDPALRPQSAPELLDVLGQVDVTAPKRRRTALLASSVGALALALVAGGFWWHGHSAPDELIDPSRVLVVPPSTRGDAGLRQVSSITSDAVTRLLGQLSFVQIAEPPSALASARDVSDNDALETGKRLRAGTIIAGTLYPAGADSVQIQFRVLDAYKSAVSRVLPPVRLARDAGDSAWNLALEPLLSTVAIAGFPGLGPATLPIGPVPRFAAVQELITSFLINARDSSSREQKLIHAQRAVQLDSAYLQARMWAVLALQNAKPTSYYAETRVAGQQLAEQLSPLREKLSPFERALLDYLDTYDRGNTGGRLSALRQMASIAPQTDLSRLLATTLLDLNRPNEALDILEDGVPVRNADGKLIPAAQDPGHWRLIATIQHYLGNHKAERDAALELNRLDPDDISSVRYELLAFAALGDSAGIEDRLAAAAALPPKVGTSDFFGDLLLQTGQELIAHGHPALGESLERRSLEWFESRSPAQRDQFVTLRWALALHALHQEEKAREVLKPLFKKFPDLTLYAGLEGRIAASMGDTATAQEIDARLAAMSPAGLLGANTQERAFIAADLGHKEEAVRLLQEAFAQGLGFSIRWRLHWFNDLAGLRGYAPFEQLLQPKG